MNWLSWRTENQHVLQNFLELTELVSSFKTVKKNKLLLTVRGSQGVLDAYCLFIYGDYSFQTSKKNLKFSFLNAEAFKMQPQFDVEAQRGHVSRDQSGCWSGFDLVNAAASNFTVRRGDI